MSVFAASALVIALLMTTVWLISLLLRDVSIIDLVWGTGFVLIAWTAMIVAHSDEWLLPLLTTIWGLRLSLYLGWRNHGQPEDHRYQAMRQRHGSSFPVVSLFTVFGLQGLVMWIVSLPLQAGVITGETEWVSFKVTGTALWATGLFFESVGDWQLARFKSNPENAGRVMDRGLWRYTRHPNYFGDFLVWWGLYLVAVSASQAWWTAVGPAVMSVFLMRVSGVTLLEKSLRRNRPDYVEYMERTNAFFPGIPRTTPSATSDEIRS